MTIALTNLSEIRLTFVHTHEIVCAYGERCSCLPALGRRRRVPAQLSLAPRETVGGLSSALLALPAVERAVARGRLRLVRTS